MMKLVFAGIAAFELAGGCAERTSSHASRATITIGAQQINASGLNTSSNAGADRILRRFRMATRVACDVQFGARSSVEIAREQTCVDQTMQRAVSELASPTVALRHAQDIAEQRNFVA